MAESDFDSAKNRKLTFLRVVFAVFAAALVLAMVHAEVFAAGINISLTTDGEGQTSTALQIMFLFVALALAPTILLMMTGFTRIIIVLHFTRSALGTQQMPPNQVMIGIALFLTFALMAVPLGRIYDEAYVPLSNGEITQEEAIELALEPLREFMYRQLKTTDLALFAKLSGEDITIETPPEELPNRVLIPAFILGELTEGFWIGFMIYIPFIVIDMVVASVLMAMGMMMLPPAMISLPFKILLFILADGWSYLIGGLISTFK